MNPPFFERKDSAQWRRALHFLKEIIVARALHFRTKLWFVMPPRPSFIDGKCCRCIGFRTEKLDLNRFSDRNTRVVSRRRHPWISHRAYRYYTCCMITSSPRDEARLTFLVLKSSRGQRSMLTRTLDTIDDRWAIAGEC